jgi:hypothetical protein
MLARVTRAPGPGRPPRWSRAIGGAVALAAGGCYDGFDPLDPEVLAEVARTRGDALGFERSGIYGGEIEVLDCGCYGALDASGFDVSLCIALENLEMLGVPPMLDLEIVQADGTLRVRALRFGGFFDSQVQLVPVFYGPLHADGRMSAAGVLQADAITAQGQVLGRLDGTVELVDGEWAFVGEYRQRYALDLIGMSAVLDFGVDDPEVTSIDCRERIALDLRWAAPPFEPLGG